MPIFKNNKLTFEFNLDTGISKTGYDSALLSYELLKKESGIYNNGIKFFTTKIKKEESVVVRKAILLNIHNKYIAKKWKDKRIKFIKQT